MTPELPTARTATAGQRDAAEPGATQPAPATRWLWLVGTALAVLAVHSNWHVALAAWLFPIFLLRYARLRPARVGITRVGFAIALATLAWLITTSLVWAVNTVVLPVFVALAALQTLAFAADRLVATRLEARSGLLATLVFPASLVTAEYLFTVVFQFGDFGVLGFTQHANAPLIQVASVTGVYGVTFLVAWFASVASWAWGVGFRWSAIRRTVLTYVVILLLVLGAGGLRLVLSAPTTDTVRVAGVTASTEAENESSDAQEQAGFQYAEPTEVISTDPDDVSAAFAPVTDDLLRETEREAQAGARIVQWPETQAMVLQRDTEALVDEVAGIAQEHDTYINLGFGEFTEEEPHMRNKAVLVTPDGEVAWDYDKAEPTPMEGLMGIEPGAGDVPVADSPLGRLATVICYDADFPQLMGQAADKDADVLLVPANDWRGFENLHAERATMRSVEYGYAQVRQSVNGVSTAIDQQGQELGETNHFTTDEPTMVAEVPTQERTSTVYSTIGDVFAWLCIAATAGFVLGVGRRVVRTRPASHDVTGETASS